MAMMAEMAERRMLGFDLLLRGDFREGQRTDYGDLLVRLGKLQSQGIQQVDEV
jgi:hypothetical protein